MPLHHHLQQESATFDPPTVKLMTDAYLEACRLLRLTPRDDGATRLLAKRIIDAARSGERDPERLVRRGLQERSSTTGGGFLDRMVRAVPVFDFEEALVIERDGEALADEFDP